MTERAHELSATADLQIAELTELLSRLDRHRTPRFLRALSHGSHETSTTSPRPRDHGADQHDDGYTADNIDLDAVVEQLRTSRNTLGRIAELTDSQLDQVPPAESFRFCDGQRTFEQVLAGLLKRRANQLQALRTAT